MSYFGDKTPHQEMLEYSEYIQHEYDLTNEEIVIILLKVVNAFNDPLDNKSDELRRKVRNV